MKIYRFYIPALDKYIYLNSEEALPFFQRVVGKIGWTEFYKSARDVLRKHRIPRGYLKYTMMRILVCIENEEYDEYEIPEVKIPVEEVEIEKIKVEKEIKEVKYLKVRCRWWGRTEYCERSGHHLVTEAHVVFEFTIPETCFEEYRSDIEHEIDRRLFDTYISFLETEYVLIYERTDSGIEELEEIDSFYVPIGTPLEYDLITADFYVGRNCAFSPEWRDDLSPVFESYVDDALDRFIGWLEHYCGVRW